MPDSAKIDPELQPLSVYERQQAVVARQSGKAMEQMTLGLLAVLVLFAGFARWLLPRLIARYPQFFESLRQRQETTNISALQPSTFKRIKASVFANATKAESTISPPVQSAPFIMEKLGMRHTDYASSPALQILSSTALGAGRELFLVDVPGRRLLLASTPETITVLQDLSEPPMAGSPQDVKTRQAAIAWVLDAEESSKSLKASLPNQRENEQKPCLSEASPEMVVLPDYDDTF